MGTTLFVWYLLCVGGHDQTEVTYSPPITNVETCTRVRNVVYELAERGKPRCQCMQLITPVPTDKKPVLHM